MENRAAVCIQSRTRKPISGTWKPQWKAKSLVVEPRHVSQRTLHQSDRSPTEEQQSKQKRRHGRWHHEMRRQPQIPADQTHRSRWITILKSRERWPSPGDGELQLRHLDGVRDSEVHVTHHLSLPPGSAPTRGDVVTAEITQSATAVKGNDCSASSAAPLESVRSNVPAARSDDDDWLLQTIGGPQPDRHEGSAPADPTPVRSIATGALPGACCSSCPPPQCRRQGGSATPGPAPPGTTATGTTAARQRLPPAGSAPSAVRGSFRAGKQRLPRNSSDSGGATHRRLLIRAPQRTWSRSNSNLHFSRM